MLLDKAQLGRKRKGMTCFRGRFDPHPDLVRLFLVGALDKIGHGDVQESVVVDIFDRRRR